MPTTTRHILITGGSSGIGAALARHYAAPGIRIALSGRDAERLAAVAAACRERGAIVEAVQLDVIHCAAMARWIAAADGTAPLDLVIANAGISSLSNENPESELRARRVFAVNLEGVINTLYPAIAAMAPRGRGQIGLMSSIAGFRGFPDAPSYCAAKAAVRVLAEAMRGSLRPRGILVSAICPGFVESRITAGSPFPMPFLMTAERAAAIIARGLARDRGRIAFPWPMLAAGWLLAAMPAGMADRVTARLGRRRPGGAPPS